MAACTTVALIGSPVVQALAASQLEQAELTGLTLELQAQVEARAVDGDSVAEMLLNNIKIKHQAGQIVAMEWGKGHRGGTVADWQS